MLEVCVRLLAGRYHATPWDRHPREGEPEWPPSPWRLLRALAASYYRTPEHYQQSAVESLVQTLSAPPEFHLPRATASHTRQYFPQGSPGDKQLLFDSFVRVGSQEQDLIVFRWPEIALSGEELDLLQQLLSGISYFGRAESWAELSANAKGSRLAINCAPGSARLETQAVRVLGAAPAVTWNQLTVQTGQLQKEGWSAPPGSRWLTYQRDLACFEPRLNTPESRLKPVAVRYSYLRPLRPRLANALYCAESWRTDFLRLLKDKVGDELFQTFAAKNTDGSARNHGHSHPYILPLPSSGRPHVEELLVYQNQAFPAEVLELLAGGLTRMHNREKRTFRLQFMEFLDLEQLRSLPIFQPATVWQSLTPYVQTRHLKRGKETLLDQLRRELDNHGKPGCLLESVENAGPVIQDVPLRDFKTTRRDRPRPTGGVHNLRLIFSEPISGPLTLGYAAHFGLGQFRSH